MKKADLERYLEELAESKGAELKYEGGTKHDKYSLKGAMIMIPRHREIGEILAKKIIRDAKRALE